jgi:hypothetical protein
MRIISASPIVVSVPQISSNDGSLVIGLWPVGACSLFDFFPAFLRRVIAVFSALVRQGVVRRFESLARAERLETLQD